ncbi:hypothetical protein [Chitinophaga rhizosphaerae]|uniref:hypothetical protein n=1 Tax=Chitinophaga rhizosphaerae TaxID=1864947 RepID=UPI000F80DAF3|nr:hypothetical protein [Chitinophaga rhizosphaerae]
MDFIQFISAFGLGAIVTALIQAWISHQAEIRKRNFQEKKECYIGFLDAIQKSDVEQTPETGAYLAHWINRIELVGSAQVIFLCMRFFETNPVNDTVHPDRPKVFRDLKEAMRKDLGVVRIISS